MFHITFHYIKASLKNTCKCYFIIWKHPQPEIEFFGCDTALQRKIISKSNKNYSNTSYFAYLKQSPYWTGALNRWAGITLGSLRSNWRGEETDQSNCFFLTCKNPWDREAPEESWIEEQTCLPLWHIREPCQGDDGREDDDTHQTVVCPCELHNGVP